MIKEIIQIKSKSLDYKNLEENHISIQLSLDGFSFCIYNKIQQDISAFATYQFIGNNITPFQHLELVEQLYKEEELLQLKYKSVSVSHFNNLVSQVPEPFFDKTNLASYLQFSLKVLENDFIAYDALTNSEIINVYIPFVNINNFLLDTYGSFEYKHSSTILIESLLNGYKNSPNDYCFVNVSKNLFEIVVIQNKKLTLFNCFSFKTKEDFIYYILFTAEQLNLNPEEFKLILLGEIKKESELYDILFKYIRNITFYNPTTYPSLLKEETPLHSNFTLLNQF